MQLSKNEIMMLLRMPHGIRSNLFAMAFGHLKQIHYKRRDLLTAPPLFAVKTRHRHHKRQQAIISLALSTRGRYMRPNLSLFLRRKFCSILRLFS